MSGCISIDSIAHYREADRKRAVEFTVRRVCRMNERSEINRSDRKIGYGFALARSRVCRRYRSLLINRTVYHGIHESRARSAVPLGVSLLQRSVRAHPQCISPTQTHCDLYICIYRHIGTLHVICENRRVYVVREHSGRGRSETESEITMQIHPSRRNWRLSIVSHALIARVHR